MAEEKNEKTAGSSARMEPGTERGGCRQQRRPELLSTPTKQLTTLLKQCDAIATHLQHNPQVWFVNVNGRIATVRCKACNRRAGVALCPAQGNDPISGALVNERCE